MNLSHRQQKIIEIVTSNGPITGDQIADLLGCSKSTLRSDLHLLTHMQLLHAKPKVGYVYGAESPSHFPMNPSILDTKVKDIKSSAVCVAQDDSLYNAIIQAFTCDAGTIFAVDENNCLTGILSRKDFLKSILGNPQIQNIPVSVIMTRMPNIITTTDEETVLQAAEKIMLHKIDALPVVEKLTHEQYLITGRISKTNISHFFVQMSSRIKGNTE